MAIVNYFVESNIREVDQPTIVGFVAVTEEIRRLQHIIHAPSSTKEERVQASHGLVALICSYVAIQPSYPGRTVQ